jgi:hypothetical protein
MWPQAQHPDDVVRTVHLSCLNLERRAADLSLPGAVRRTDPGTALHKAETFFQRFSYLTLSRLRRKFFSRLQGADARAPKRKTAMTLSANDGFRAKMLIGAFALILSGAAAALAGPARVQTAEDGWTTYIAAEGEPKTFVSPDGKAKLVVSGADNDEGFTLADYRKTILDEFGGYDRLDYSPKGQSWFVLSGYRDETIYYQKVLFSCNGRIINALSVTFPAAEKAFYEGLIEIIEDGFRPGRGVEAPARCTS